MKAKGLAMRNFKPTTVILAFAAMSFVSAKAITSPESFMAAAPAPTAEAELMTLRTTTPVIIDDTEFAAALSGEHIETRKLILTTMSEDVEPKIPMLKEVARPDVGMSKPYLIADATPAPAASAGKAASVVNKSATEQTIAVDSGQAEKIYSIAPGASVTLEGCAAGCTVTGPWGYSRDVKAGEVVETSGKSEVTVAGKEKTVAKKAAASASAPAKKAAATMSAPAKKKIAKASKGKTHAAAKAKPAKAKEAKFNPYFKGSFTSLFTGIVR